MLLLTAAGTHVPHWHRGVQQSRCMLGLLLMYLMHVYSVKAHLGRCELRRQRWMRLTEDPGVTCRHADDHKGQINDCNLKQYIKYELYYFYLSPSVWSLLYTGLSCVCLRPCERDRCPAWGCWDDDRDARTLAAAEAALFCGIKRRFHAGTPDAVRTGWANTLANRLSGWRKKNNTTQ